MSYDTDSRSRAPYQPSNRRMRDVPRTYRDEIYSQRIRAGRRKYFFDVRPTKSGQDFFITITEKRRIDERRYEKHKVRLYKEDFAKFVRGLHDVIRHIQDECLPDYEFVGLPDFSYLHERQATKHGPEEFEE